MMNPLMWVIYFDIVLLQWPDLVGAVRLECPQTRASELLAGVAGPWEGMVRRLGHCDA